MDKYSEGLAAPVLSKLSDALESIGQPEKINSQE
jgi:hypothetical protein